MDRFATKSKWKWKSNSSSTEAGVVHFLRSILTEARHASSSPWVVTTSPSLLVEEEDDDQDQDDDNDHQEEKNTNTPGMVVLVLPAPLAVLQDFRVSDACPSWFLHGYATCDALELLQSNQDQNQTREGATSARAGSSAEPFWNSTTTSHPAAASSVHLQKIERTSPIESPASTGTGTCTT
jgi:hypothetical protein